MKDIINKIREIFGRGLYEAEPTVGLSNASENPLFSENAKEYVYNDAFELAFNVVGVRSLPSEFGVCLEILAKFSDLKPEEARAADKLMDGATDSCASNLKRYESDVVSALLNVAGVVSLCSGNRDKARSYFNVALKFNAKKINPAIQFNLIMLDYEDFLAEYYFVLGISSSDKSKLGEVCENYLELFKDRIRAGGLSAAERAAVFYKMAGIYGFLGDDKNKEFYLTNSIPFFEEEFKSNYGAISNIYDKTAEFYSKKKDYNKSISFGLKRIDLYDKYGETDAVKRIAASNAIGRVYFDSGDYDNAAKSYRVSSEFIESISEESYCDVYRAIFFNDMGMVYFKKEEYEKALYYRRKALEVYERGKVEVNLNSSEALTYSSIGEIYFKLKNFAKFDEYFLKAVDICARNFAPDNIVSLVVNNSYSSFKKAQNAL